MKAPCALLKINSDEDSSAIESFRLYFKFEKRSAAVRIEVLEKKKIRIISETDGYHWLEFWLSQNPDNTVLEERNDAKQDIAVVTFLFRKIGWQYVSEDKESGFLYLDEDFTTSVISKLADIIEPRFGLREKFFND